MKPNEIIDFKNNTVRSIRNGHLHEAFQSMRAFASRAGSWQLINEVDTLSQSYGYMLLYISMGSNDPEQESVYNDLVTQALAVVDSLVRHAFTNEHSTLYYSTVRTLSAHSGDSLPLAIDRYIAELRRLNDDIDSLADPNRTQHAEGLMREVFNRLWVTHPLTTADWSAIDQLLSPDSATLVPLSARALAIGGITLGGLEFFDEHRIGHLLSLYTDSRYPASLRLRALVGVLAMLFRFRSRTMPASVTKALDSVKQHPDWVRDFTAISIEMMRTTETDSITDRLRSQMTDSMQSIDPELRAKLQSGDFNPESLSELNPEWEQQLAHSELADTFKEMHRLQADGGDVFMASFSSMKQMPFFNEPANWFLPFDPTHSAVTQYDGIEGNIGSLLSNMPMLCDSDKYSMMLSLGMVPTASRDSIVASVQQHGNALFEAMKHAPHTDDDHAQRAAIVSHYIQDLHRFFKLFRRKGEFFPLFSHKPHLLEVQSIAQGFDNVEALDTMASFFFDHKFWHQAAHTYSLLDALDMPQAARAQKWAYSLEMDGHLDEAISRYEEAELLDGGSQWTLRRLAAAHRRAGNTQRALALYSRLAQQLPDDGPITLAYGYVLTEANQPNLAEPQFFKAAYLMPDSFKPLRALAWVQFCNGKYDAAVDTYSKFIADGNDGDWLNYGHTLLASGRTKEAVKAYRKYTFQFQKDLDAAIAADTHHLTAAGLSPSYITLITQATKYAKES